MYNPANWYWFIGTDTTQVWSSAHAALIAVNDAAYTEWLSEGNIPSKVTEKNDVLVITIEALEAKVTQRRLRDAVLGTDGGWLETLNTQIAGLRAQLT